MSLLNGNSVKAKEVLDYCMDSESPELKAKVWEIVSLSGLEPNDPMFLALLLTGQMRVLLEAAPEKLNQLLSEWKLESADSLSEISSAVSRVKKTQIEQAEAIKENMEAVSNKCVSDIKEAGMSTVGAIATANSETFEQVALTKKQNEELFEEIIALKTSLKTDRQKNTEIMKAVVDWVEKTTRRQETVNQQISKSISEVGKIQQKKVWLRIADGFYSLPVLVTSMLIIMGGTWWAASTRYNQPLNIFGRQLVDWNVERINHCRETENPQCTVWIVPPGSPQRNE